MKLKKKVTILVVVCLVILVCALVADKILSKNYFTEIKYNSLIEKIENKEDLIVLISQTTCGHCTSYKPKLEDMANKHKIEIHYIDVDLLDEDEYNNLVKYINFSSTPVTVFLKNGEEKTAVNRINGDASRDKIERKLKSNGFID
jgi:thiol-disulfide isomerase/thioredoxin